MLSIHMCVIISLYGPGSSLGASDSAITAGLIVAELDKLLPQLKAVQGSLPEGRTQAPNNRHPPPRWIEF